ncbi:MAG TPA: hypothetical protein VGS07_09605 [Thermoanaerobaculia bacterium]|jgi:hypothetical protein|nr:hypothetical protein [Thermoanaerobaculia bacterium]
MKLNTPTDSETPDAPTTTLNGSAPQDSLDGDFPIEGDAGTVDNSSQAHVPPPPPA